MTKLVAKGTLVVSSGALIFIKLIVGQSSDLSSNYLEDQKQRMASFILSD